MIVWGTLTTQCSDSDAPARWPWVLATVGIAAALATFMIDSWRALPDGRTAVLKVLPTRFRWTLFWPALVLMASPALHRMRNLADRLPSGPSYRTRASAPRRQPGSLVN
jgi:hypothetical protein